METLLQADVRLAKSMKVQAGDLAMAFTANSGSEMQNGARSNATDPADQAAELAGQAGQQLDKVIATAESAVRGVTEHGGTVYGALSKRVVGEGGRGQPVQS